MAKDSGHGRIAVVIQRDGGNDGISSIDILKAIAVYFGVNVVRFLSVSTFYPLLRRLGTGFDWRTGAVVVWGGLYWGFVVGPPHRA